MIHHIYSTKETIQKFPGIKPYKESWFITEKFQNHKNRRLRYNITKLT